MFKLLPKRHIFFDLVISFITTVFNKKATAREKGKSAPSCGSLWALSSHHEGSGTKEFCQLLRAAK